MVLTTYWTLTKGQHSFNQFKLLSLNFRAFLAEFGRICFLGFIDQLTWSSCLKDILRLSPFLNVDVIVVVVIDVAVRRHRNTLSLPPRIWTWADSMFCSELVTLKDLLIFGEHIYSFFTNSIMFPIKKNPFISLYFGVIFLNPGNHSSRVYHLRSSIGRLNAILWHVL